MPKGYHIQTGQIGEVRFYKDFANAGLLPRVSEIAKLFPKPMLERWKCEKVHESGCVSFEDAYAYMQNIGEQAANAGTEIHAIIEGEANGKEYSYNERLVSPDIAAAVKANYRAWWQTMSRVGWVDMGTEITIIDGEVGYGGRCDKILEQGRLRMILDWKTQDVKNGKPTFYDEWVFQLAAYCMNGRNRKRSGDYLVSIVVDRLTGKFYTKEWTDEEFLWGWEVFQDFHRAYCSFHGIDMKQILNNFNKTVDNLSNEVKLEKQQEAV